MTEQFLVPRELLEDYQDSLLAEIDDRVSKLGEGYRPKAVPAMTRERSKRISKGTRDAYVQAMQEDVIDALRARVAVLEGLLRRWDAIDGGLWNVARYEMEKAELMRDTKAALNPPAQGDSDA